MKALIPRFIFTLLLTLSFTKANAQLLEKVKQSAGKSAERTIQKKVEEKTEKVTEQAIDSTFSAPGKIVRKEKKKKKDKKNNTAEESTSENTNSGNTNTDIIITKKPDSIETGKDPELEYKGTEIFTDDFSTTPVGGFPGKFVSSSGGEIVQINSKNGLLLGPNSNLLLNLENLPDNFALEFDLTLNNVPRSLYNTFLNVYFQELKTLNHNDNKNKFGAVGFSLWRDEKDQNLDVFNKKATYTIADKIPFTINRDIIENTSRFTILINGNRLRWFINGEKVADSHNLLEGVDVNYINFRLNGTKKENKQYFIISNLSVTSINKDLRSEIIENGGFSTNEILFASGSNTIQSSSYDFLNKLVDVLSNDPAINLSIIGHTDSDGNEADNLTLSEQRAESVKNYLIEHGISAQRLQAEGKGESEPVASNTTTEGKEKNRRVEFKKR